MHPSRVCDNYGDWWCSMCGACISTPVATPVYPHHAPMAPPPLQQPPLPPAKEEEEGEVVAEEVVEEEQEVVEEEVPTRDQGTQVDFPSQEEEALREKLSGLRELAKQTERTMEAECEARLKLVREHAAQDRDKLSEQLRRAKREKAQLRDQLGEQKARHQEQKEQLRSQLQGRAHTLKEQERAHAEQKARLQAQLREQKAQLRRAKEQPSADAEEARMMLENRLEAAEGRAAALEAEAREARDKAKLRALMEKRRGGVAGSTYKLHLGEPLSAELLSAVVVRAEGRGEDSQSIGLLLDEAQGAREVEVYVGAPIAAGGAQLRVVREGGSVVTAPVASAEPVHRSLNSSVARLRMKLSDERTRAAREEAEQRYECENKVRLLVKDASSVREAFKRLLTHREEELGEPPCEKVQAQALLRMLKEGTREAAMEALEAGATPVEAAEAVGGGALLPAAAKAISELARMKIRVKRYENDFYLMGLNMWCAELQDAIVEHAFLVHATREVARDLGELMAKVPELVVMRDALLRAAPGGDAEARRLFEVVTHGDHEVSVDADTGLVKLNPAGIERRIAAYHRFARLTPIAQQQELRRMQALHQASHAESKRGFLALLRAHMGGPLTPGTVDEQDQVRSALRSEGIEDLEGLVLIRAE